MNNRPKGADVSRASFPKNEKPKEGYTCLRCGRPYLPGRGCSDALCRELSRKEGYEEGPVKGWDVRLVFTNIQARSGRRATAKVLWKLRQLGLVVRKVEVKEFVDGEGINWTPRDGV